jgi:ketosteroid isomerase-like protein
VVIVSDENVEVVRNALEHFAATDEFLDVIAPDFVWDMGSFEGWPDRPEFHGTAGLREFVSLWREPYDDWSMELHQVHDCGGNRVLALLHQRGKPHGSDSDVHLEYGLLHTVEGGLIHRIEAYATLAAALRAAGLSA